LTGYQLVEKATLSPSRPHGIRPNSYRIGLLDFLRELAAEELAFPKFQEMQVVGLEEVLYAARPEDARLALEIRDRLRRVASDMERRLLSVQIVFRGKLKRGDDLWVEYRGTRLPIGHIFGYPVPQSDTGGNRFFLVNFNLTS